MNKTNALIQFHFLTTTTLSKRLALKAFIASIFKKQKRPVESLSIIFCNDSYLLALNRRFLKHDYYTDIISFPLSKRGERLIAEIYISIDRIRDNARNLDNTFKEELHRVIFHGVLHFCGYKDKSAKDSVLMRSMEDKQLKAYFRSKP